MPYILSTWIGHQPPVPLVISVDPADQAAGWFDKELGVIARLQVGSTDEEAVAAVVMVRGPRWVVVADDGFNRDGVDAISGNHEVCRDDPAIGKGY